MQNRLNSIKLTESLLPVERQQRILCLIKEGATIKITYLSKFLDMYEMTIRRVLDFLDEKGVVGRTSGGGLFRQEWIDNEFNCQNSVPKHPQLKRHIAQPAAALINPHDIVFLGKGRTTASVLRYADPAIPFKTDRKIASDLYRDLKFMGVLADIHNY